MFQGNQIIQGDCTEVLKTLPDRSVDFVLTDPPYFVRYKDRHGRTIKNDTDPASVLGAFKDVYRVLKPDSFCVCFYGWSKVDAFFSAWTTAGFQPVGHIVWQKGYASRSGFLQSRHEQAFLLAKGKPAKPGKPLNDVRPWEYSGNRFHPTEKAVSVLKPLIESFSQPGELVLDPFSGSGSTSVAAALSGRRYVGIELEAKYVEYARKRLNGVARFARKDAPATATQGGQQ
jgi:DNA modification methylase